MFPRSLVRQMAAEADAAIDDALLHGAGPIVRPKKEVAYVAAVTLGGIYDIAAAWTPICSGRGVSLRLAGVFCHAAPIVRFRGKSGKTDCELADLLVVTDIRKRGVLTRRAALIQTKMARAKQRVSLTGPSSRKQLDLYQNWYHFDFLDPAYPMSRVNFRVGTRPFWSGTFGAIDPRFDAQPRWTQHRARPTPGIITNHDPRLGCFIAEMADGTRPGFGRLATPSLDTDWSKTVELLLRVTCTRAFADKAILGPARPPRGANAVVCFEKRAMAVSKSAFKQLDGLLPPLGLIPEHVEREPNGLSVLHLELATGQD
jgi:hypothetical protein